MAGGFPAGGRSELSREAGLKNYKSSSSHHGFRPRLSTSHQLLRVVEYIKDAIDRNQYTAAVFLDIQKAFDRVWHTGLLYKLIKYKIPPH
ncbi:putative RNA-directed DNA polymerase from transposon X-element [Trichonephila clavipes]|nr:putative RNA-directed DNA polymerase from transposon X-element [Trichonephila clavipes]